MSSTSFLAAMTKVVIVAIDNTPRVQCVVCQIWIEPAVMHLIEQPMRRPVFVAAAAIGIKRRRERPGLHECLDSWIIAQVPGLVEITVGLMAQALTGVQVVSQHRRV